MTFGAGKVPVGIDSSDTDFDTAEETGGAKTHTLTESEIPSHTHTLSIQGIYQIFGGGGGFRTRYEPGGTTTTASTGGGQPHNNLQPYIVVYMWKRTA